MMLLLVVAIITSPVVLFAALVSTIISAIVALVQVQIVGSLERIERDPSLTASCSHDTLAGGLTQAASFDLACNWTSGCTAKIVLATIFMINALIIPCSLHLFFLRFLACPQIGRVLIYNIAI